MNQKGHLTVIFVQFGSSKQNLRCQWAKFDMVDENFVVKFFREFKYSEKMKNF